MLGEQISRIQTECLPKVLEAGAIEFMVSAMFKEQGIEVTSIQFNNQGFRGIGVGFMFPLGIEVPVNILDAVSNLTDRFDTLDIDDSQSALIITIRDGSEG